MSAHAITSDSELSVGIADDHPVVLRGVRQLLAETRYEVIWQALSRPMCVQAFRAREPDILILDLRLGDDLAPDVLREIRLHGGSIPRVVVLTGHDDRQLINACLDAGVAGVLFKDTIEMDIVQSLEKVVAGETVLDPRLTRSSSDEVRRSAGCGVSSLTSREHDVLRLVAHGMTSRDIAGELCLSVNTVRSYVQSVLFKFNAHTRIEAVATARRLRLL